MDESRTQSPSPVAEAAERRPDLTDVLRWHGGWAGALAFAGVVLWLTVPWTRGAGFALAIDAAPALGFFIARNYDGPRLRTGLLIAWTAAGAAAAVLTGGLASPLAVWCLAPLVAAVLLGGRHRLAQGAALALVAVAVTALAQAAGLAGVQPTGPLSFGLGLTGLATTAAGAAFGLLLKRSDAETAPAASAMSPGSDDAAAILEAQPYLVLVLDRAGQVQRAFGRAPAGIDGQALRGGGLVKLVAGGDYLLFREALADAARDGTARFSFRRNGVESMSLILDVARLSEDRLAATLRDVSAERAREAGLENAVAEAQSLAAGRSRFLANMSHELRTPLNAIMGFSDIMREKIFGELSPKYGEYADLIHDAGTHLLDLINDVLDMSKIEAAKYELKLDRLDAREPVSAGLRLMRGQADDVGVTLRGVLPPQPLEVDADGRALKQIVLNLISNALKFTPRGGLVTVSLHALAGAMELSVADSGIGISAADLERLGKPYEQAGDAGQQARGTGLGLSLVRAFAELHGGEMVIESQLGEGTAVTVRLPVLASAAEPALAEPDEAPLGGAQVIAFNPQR
jgi:cell cycle sensor histidine kinase DivJ